MIKAYCALGFRANPERTTAQPHPRTRDVLNSASLPDGSFCQVGVPFLFGPYVSDPSILGP